MKKSLNIVGYITALLLFSSVIFKTNHLPGSNIIMLLSGLALSIYLPLILLYKPGSADAVKSPAGIMGAVSASAINMGITLKFLHSPGAAIMLVLGLTSFALLYIPLLLRQKQKEEGSERKTLMNTSGATGLTLFSMGLLFKIMHWPGASVMVTLSVFFLFFGYFLLYMLDRSIDQETKTNYLRKAFFAVIVGCMVSSLIMVSLSKPYIAPQQAMVEADH